MTNHTLFWIEGVIQGEYSKEKAWLLGVINNMNQCMQWWEKPLTTQTHNITQMKSKVVQHSVPQ